MKYWNRQDIIKAYIEFFKKKNHKEIPSSSLIPENDPTVLFTTAGMHPLVPYLLGEKHPLGKRLVNVQKCLRTGDIDEVGNSTHHTFFEMLGNWSLGDYYKEDAIKFSFEFMTKVLKIPMERLGVTIFEGDRDASKDSESAKIWESLGIKKERISFRPKKDNWWGPAGEIGPCGPDTEMYYWKNNGKKPPRKFNPDDKDWVEIWNDVFMEYNKTKEGYFKAPQQNVDTGMGVERTIAVLNGLEDNYLSPIFLPIIKEVEKISKHPYKDEKDKRAIRIIADHVRAAVFILGDERAIKPSNMGQGYILRRLIRRAIRYGKILGIKGNFTSGLSEVIISVYPDYPELKKNLSFIKSELEKEESRFSETLENGLKKFNYLTGKKIKEISGKDAFLLFQSYGFPLEMTVELAEEKKISVNSKEFEKEFEKHQKLSRTASAGTFKSGLADNSDKTRRLHTATHLLNEALKVVLNDKSIKQKGSNITPERLRFDFNMPRKITDEEIKRIESWVNDKISRHLAMKREEMPLKKAFESGAEGEFGAKYPEIVSVYTLEDKKDKRGYASREICTGPHVANTSEIGKFKIIKEESVASGIRRIKAIVE